MVTRDSELTEEMGGASVCKLRGCELEWMKMFPRARLFLLDCFGEPPAQRHSVTS